jgi:protein-tyrosine phosphatase
VATPLSNASTRLTPVAWTCHVSEPEPCTQFVRKEFSRWRWRVATRRYAAAPEAVGLYMDRERHLDWDGCCNVRDLGGLPAAGGRRTRWGAVVRADAIDRLTPAGWAALEAHGVRTIVDLRNDDEREGLDGAARPAGITTVHVPLDGIEDRAFWDVWATGPQFGTLLYYGPFLERFPQRAAAAVAAVARAAPGGVALHCVGGRDRTGLISILLLALAGVAPRDIAADYALSAPRLRARALAHGEADPGAGLEAYLRERGTTADEVIVALLRTLDVAAYLGAAGVADAELTAVCGRMLD